MQVPEISVIIPVYGAPELISELCNRLHKSLREITQDYEIILVFDCSPDDSWERICKECKQDERVKGIRLSRNFGQHYAITAGLEHAGGKWIVVMDCDLQDQPEEICKLYQKAQEGYDIVRARRATRKDNYVKKLSSLIFHRVFAYLTDTESDPSIANFGVYSKDSIKAYLAMGDQARCFPIMISWVGFTCATVSVNHSSRKCGKSSYNFRSLCQLAIDTSLSFSDKPLRLTVKLGLLMSVASLLFAVYILLKFFYGGITVSGFTSLMISIWFLSGITIFVMGMLGLYIGKIFDRVKDRPLYIIRERINLG